MGALKHSPIKTLTVHMLSLNTSHWMTLLGELNMPVLEDVELEGDIPQPALIRFLIKHEGLKNIRIRENIPSDRAQPTRLQCATFLPNLLTLHAPLMVCCNIVERASNPSRLYDLEVEVNRFHPNDPSFLHLLRACSTSRNSTISGFALCRVCHLSHKQARMIMNGRNTLPASSDRSIR